jgi:hypothetical protein
MLGISYDTLTGYIAAFSALSTAIALAGHERRQRVHVTLALFLLTVAGAFFSRSLRWHLDDEIHIGYAYSLFAALPLLLCIFIENLIRRPVSSKTKFGIVLVMTFFVLTTWIDVFKSNTWWKVAFMTYHLLSFSVLLLPLRSTSKSSGLVEQERHVLNSIFGVVIIGTVFIAFEWLYAIGPMHGLPVRLSSVAVMIFSHNLTCIYFNEHRFSLKKELWTIATFLAFSLVTAQIITITGLTLGPYMALVSVVFASALVFSTLNQQIVSSYSTSGISRTVKQLVDINKTQPPLFLKQLSKIAEFKNLRLISPDLVEMLNCEILYSSLRANEVYSPQKLASLLRKKGLTPDMQDSLQAARYFLISVGAQAMIVTGNRGEILVASPVALRSTKYFESLLLWASQTLELVRSAANQNQISHKVKNEVPEGASLLEAR